MSRDNAPEGELEGSILGNLGSLGSKIVLFVACDASLASNSAGENHQPQSGLFFIMKRLELTAANYGRDEWWLLLDPGAVRHALEIAVML